MHETTRSLLSPILLGGLCGLALVLVLNIRPRRAKNRLSEAQLDEMILETFPASDSPSYWPLGSYS